MHRWHSAIIILAALVYGVMCCYIFLAIEGRSERPTKVLHRSEVLSHSPPPFPFGEARSRDLALALRSPTHRRLTWTFQPWTLPLDGPSELPYENDVSLRNATHVVYGGGSGSVYLSSAPAEVLEGTSGLGNCGLDAARQMRRVAALDQGPAASSRAVVALFDFVDAGYWGHAIENLWPRLAPILRLGVDLTVVIPRTSILSSHTSQLAEALGLRIVRGTPPRSRRFLWMCDLPSYHPGLRSDFAAAARERLGIDHQRDECTGVIFLSRAHGTAHGRNPREAHRLEADLKEVGVDVLDDIGSITLRQLAGRIGHACGLAGASGSALFHMTWLRPGSDVWVLFPRPSGTQYGYLWLHAHSLGHRYHHVLEPYSLIQRMAGLRNRSR